MQLVSSFSELLGYTSIACWLGAQFPQVLENIRNQSVEGLALPFLMNWLLGDATNLLGCVLTHQLPFQTYLATYFVIVDFSLLSQFFYYQSKAKKESRPYLHARDRTGSVVGARHSIERSGPGAPHYRALSNVAANVAAVAALAAQQEERARWHPRSRSSEPHASTFGVEDDDDDGISEDALARLADSFHSEGGRSARRKHVAWGQDSFTSTGSGRGPSARGSRQSSRMPTALQMTIPLEGSVDSLARGRPEVRTTDATEEDEEWLSANTARRSSRASRKSATMVFMGVWALFGVGALSGGRGVLSKAVGQRSGKVLARAEVPVVLSRSQPTFVSDDLSVDHILSKRQGAEGAMVEFETTAESVFMKAEPEVDLEFLIGRISAWACTTLYLTSRLPQIWKNYVRKSVEGLSVYLFIFAFLGNFFYVASILTSPNMQLPQPEASAFLRESIPYILGSGGTLMFDITIVTQSYLYRSKPAIRGRRQSHTYNEEEAGLLSAEATGAEDSPVASRRRGGSVSRESGH
ncbi:PQ loop repeat-domain-containing protein [Epithele typhae]|uniref:PQ loop repeat-domain-containing protein n=1 Tax=Epithele typhae TaxID=378194 RepID=UPI002008B2AB|nr:PQ loop repeat-domain-containing protein [Epithele typhae]KAH9946113.1 PQ loop repeat-domain-containing protein [Epithele typhae]